MIDLAMFPKFLPNKIDDTVDNDAWPNFFAQDFSSSGSPNPNRPLKNSKKPLPIILAKKEYIVILVVTAAISCRPSFSVIIPLPMAAWSPFTNDWYSYTINLFI